MFFQRTRVWFPAFISVSSQLPVSPAVGDPVPSKICPAQLPVHSVAVCVRTDLNCVSLEDVEPFSFLFFLKHRF